tara:strand:- start:149 stop:613 length:465 start_codon:yes stop_codon:yes gene_type:complete
MALADEVVTRISAELLKGLTNQDDPTATVYDATVLAAAVADAGAEFLLETGLALDYTIAAHTAAGVEGVLYYLRKWTSNQKGLEEAERRWGRYLKKVARGLGAERRIMPSTTSVLEVAEETQDGRPDFGRANLDDMVPRMPGSYSDETDEDYRR